MFSKLVKGMKEWYKRNSDPNYAYLCESTDIVDFERRLRDLNNRPTSSKFPLYFVS